MRDEKDAKLVQGIILTLADGRQLTYFGPYQLPVEDVPFSRIVEVAFTPPRSIPVNHKKEGGLSEQ